ncbi:YceI family protein [Cellulosimicrobium cellulans]|uniref:Lipid/polyisoprenoid-binding YceI-like domain-containing protein n=1 Tax=Cellulosimicrobium cellulans TaxID=1710 RepID=A0A4Y4E312_CELCE|nr:YceI family protein [Cellulosimicrobium cellulans]MDF9876718.1 hypothetical protein [Cellulosimicrobium cellulans]GED11766.1 hypothetical protein CCE02nite_37650 [Cellulosimicrobium cellulans]
MCPDGAEGEITRHLVERLHSSIGDAIASAVSATIETASLTTHHEERDAHLRSPDFLDVDAYPTIEFRSTSIDWQGEQQDQILAWARPRNRSPERAELAQERVQPRARRSASRSRARRSTGPEASLGTGRARRTAARDRARVSGAQDVA